MCSYAQAPSLKAKERRAGQSCAALCCSPGRKFRSTCAAFIKRTASAPEPNSSMAGSHPCRLTVLCTPRAIVHRTSTPRGTRCAVQLLPCARWLGLQRRRKSQCPKRRHVRRDSFPVSAAIPRSSQRQQPLKLRHSLPVCRCHHRQLLVELRLGLQMTISSRTSMSLPAALTPSCPKRICRKTRLDWL